MLWLKSVKTLAVCRNYCSKLSWACTSWVFYRCKLFSTTLQWPRFIRTESCIKKKKLGTNHIAYHFANITFFLFTDMVFIEWEDILGYSLPGDREKVSIILFDVDIKLDIEIKDISFLLLNNSFNLIISKGSIQKFPQIIDFQCFLVMHILHILNP